MRERHSGDRTISTATVKQVLEANRALGLTYVGLLEGERVVTDAGTPLLGDTHPQVGAPASGHGRMRMINAFDQGPGGPPFDHRSGRPEGPPPPPFDDGDPGRPPPPPPFFDDPHRPDFHGDGPPLGPHPPGPDPHHPRLVIEFEPISSADAVRRALASLWLSSSAAALLTAAAWILSARRHRAERAEAQLSAQRHLARLGEMSAVLAHEIRNPLAALKGHAQLLAEQVAEPQAAARVDRVVKEAVRLEQLTNDLLEFARSGAIRVAPANPGELLQRAARATDPERVAVTVAGAPDSVELDAARIEQVLINLIDNALRRRPAARSTLRRARTAGACCSPCAITVPGIAPAERARIFEPFHTTKTRGTGPGPGGREPHRRAARRPHRRRQGRRRWRYRSSASFCRITRRHHPRGAFMNPSDRASILVVDDEEGVRSFLADALAGAGHAVAQAEDGESALALIAARAFHVVLTDLRMPGMDGMTVVRELRREHPETEIIVLTAHGSIENAVQAIKEGAFDYLQKPVGSPTELRLTVARALERHRLHAPARDRGRRFRAAARLRLGGDARR